MAIVMSKLTNAVVFAYHNVGVRCLSVLLDQGIHIPLVISHEDNPGETIWFESVAELAHRHGIPVITPLDPNVPEVVAEIIRLQPDFLFSFYYRLMLKPSLLQIPRRGAFNMHGSLLPKYRGRVPVNWAIIKGEKETGATLHAMNEKPDNGAIVDQQAVPILENDTAADVFNKVTVAAEMTLHRALPGLLAGTTRLTPQDLTQGVYFGGRKAEDGIIDWGDSAANIHNLVRAVAPPYPGASTRIADRGCRVLRTLREPARSPRGSGPAIYVADDRLFADCGDGQVLQIVDLEVEGVTMTARQFAAQFGQSVRIV